MPVLFVSSLLVLVVELVLFSLLWLQSPELNLIVIIGHLVTATLAAYWFSSEWTRTTVDQRKVGLFILGLVGLLPVIGSVFLLLIDNHSALRAHGIREGLGSKDLEKETPQDLLNYFSAPDQYAKSNVRNTKDLLSSLDDESYLGLLIASRHLSDKEAYALLSDALFSPFESARLMAYSLRGKLEDRLAESREEKLSALHAASTSHQKIELHIAVAKDYLHTLDIGIESSDKNGLMNQAKQHCIKALKLDNKSSSGFRTLGKILRYQGNLEQAKKAEQRAFSLATA